MNCTDEQEVKVEQTASLVNVGGADSYCKFEQIATDWHKVLDVEVAANETNSVDEHAVMGLQTRSVVDVGGVDSYWVVLHCVSSEQTRSLEKLGGWNSNCVVKLQAVNAEHVLSVEGVPGVDWY
jgi:hypothetical protein